jgi:aminoglycoside phosphotransferase (APT) family kinase protein
MALEQREWSRRLGVIQPMQFQAALTRFGLGDFVAASPITAGLFGQNVFVTSTTGEYVLRGKPHYPWQFPAERYFASLLHERTQVPVPWPYLYDARSDIFGWPYVLMPRMPGLQLSDPEVVAQLRHQDRAGIAGALGANLAAMQALTWPVPGDYDAATDTIQPLPTSYPEHLRVALLRHLALARGYNSRTTPEDCEWVLRVVDGAQTALSEPFRPCFVMTDYKEGNLTVKQDGGAWHVGGVFDLMEGAFGDGELDLYRQAWEYLDEDRSLVGAFLTAYVAARPPRPGLLARLPVYVLHDRLIDWEYFQRPTHAPYWDAALSLQQWVAPYIARLLELAASVLTTQ